MTTTFCTDADITAEVPNARTELLAAGDSLDRIRTLVHGRIVRELARRSPTVMEADLSDRTQLKSCEVYGVLAELHFKAASRGQGYSGPDWYSQEGQRYYTMHLHELESPVSVVGDQSTVYSIRLLRG